MWKVYVAASLYMVGAVIAYGHAAASTKCYASRLGASFDQSMCAHDQNANGFGAALFWPFYLSKKAWERAQ